MNAAGKNRAEGNPQIDDRAPLSTRKGTEDRSEARDIEQLNQEKLPFRQHNVVNTVIDGDCRRVAVIRRENVIDHLAIGEITCDQDSQANKKTSHNL